MLTYKIMLIVVLVVVDTIVLRTIYLGRKIRRLRESGHIRSLVPITAEHSVFAWLSVIAIVVAVCSIESGRFADYDRFMSLHPGLFHKACAFLAFFAFISAIIWNGKKVKKYHKWIGYSALSLWAIVNVTGIRLVCIL